MTPFNLYRSTRRDLTLACARDDVKNGARLFEGWGR
jgi:hypothetical protein